MESIGALVTIEGLDIGKYPKLEAYVNKIKGLPSVGAAYKHFTGVPTPN